ncbi:MAG: hypothetical protein K1X28_05365 [Parachlamydiales bacterium]|nr:hypothetical protein [Parachlamydiales bacterium]
MKVSASVLAEKDSDGTFKVSASGSVNQDGDTTRKIEASINWEKDCLACCLIRFANCSNISMSTVWLFQKERAISLNSYFFLSDGDPIRGSNN